MIKLEPRDDYYSSIELVDSVVFYRDDVWDPIVYEVSVSVMHTMAHSLSMSLYPMHANNYHKQSCQNLVGTETIL